MNECVISIIASENCDPTSLNMLSLNHAFKIPLSAPPLTEKTEANENLDKDLFKL